jgi:branched-chain amino acid transport system ATP-binding protein
MTRALEADGLHTYYGKSHILHGVSLAVDAGEIVALLGRNGAGKTTTLRSVIGLTPPRAGRVRIAGQDVTGWPPHRIAQSGVGYVPEGRKIFGHLTVEENLYVPVSAGGRWTIDAIYQLFPALAERRAGKAGRLSGGEQEMLAVARALLVNPRLLLLDEPSQGLAPIIVADLMEAIRSMRGEGIAVLLVEQNALLALRVADRAYVLSDGEVVHAGAVEELAADTEKVKALAGASLRLSAGRAAAG